MGQNDSADSLCIIGIGASAGGLEAIREMLVPARAEDPLAYVVVQHLDPNHESMLAELLDRNTRLTVRQAEEGEPVEPGHVYIIPPGYGMGLEQGRITLTPFAQPRGLRRPIDDFFLSLALDQGANAICVILSGTGADGSAGLRAIKEHGGICIAQDRSARYDGMPNSAVATGLVDLVCPPGEVIDRITRFRRISPDLGPPEDTPVADSLAQLCNALVKRTGHDFSGYKRSTLLRRIQRRMQVLGIADSAEYLARVATDGKEADTLFGELLINVTRFFRDTDNFALLREEAIRPLVEGAHDGDELRVWVPGCSSGEEPYSLAMLFAAEIARSGKQVTAQVFATDIDERMLEMARAGRYPLAALQDIPADLRDAYTVGREGAFQISARIRDMVRFSVHSLIKDPPFSRIDLISCRNLLIYFGDGLQALALPVCHYALKSGGYLFLGPSESIGRAEHLFEPVDPKARLFRRNPGRARYPIELPAVHNHDRRPRPHPTPRTRTHTEWESSVASSRILETYAPPTLQIDRNGAVLAATGKLSKFLDFDPASTGPSFAQSLARPGLREALSALIREAGASNTRKVARKVEVISELGKQSVDVMADPLPDDTLLIIFRDRAPFEPIAGDDFEELVPSESHVQVLEAELRATRTRLRSTVEELETANEELKSSNEEMMSMNEELQSTNEELATVNDELKSKVEQLSSANADLRNLFASTSLALVTVGRSMRIRNFTRAARAVFPFQDADKGRPLRDVQGVIDEPDRVEQLTRTVIETGEPQTTRIRSREGRTVWSLSITPYKLSDGSTDGATLVFTDVTEALLLEGRLAAEGQRLKLALDVAAIGVWELDPETGALEADATVRALFDLPAEGALSLDDLLACMAASDAARVQATVGEALQTGGDFDVSFQVATSSGAVRYIRGMGSVQYENGRASITGVKMDMTPEFEHAQMRELMLREMNHRVKNLFSIISAMLRIASRKAETPQDLVADVSRRITALARSHDLTQARSVDEKVRLREVIEAALEPYRDQHSITLEGPDSIEVASEELTSLALILHEWSTNAAKYGVLGPVAGQLAVRWWQEKDDGVTLEWNESYDAALDLKEGTDGFGSTLIRSSALQLGGKVIVEQKSDGRLNRMTYRNDRYI
ncbi:PAS domain-containing protein [Pseudooceanicola sp. CBS1P-1]|uniref:PAS domain-containing protein n=1 Tax=Pseudooceanicola albus TaxID=2692189 RepID=A0A6L7G777_9RHOB|nr:MULTISPECIES: chemotaxis protein CheB [Pseudooceanicola]MBT9384101.1 PAS domain-containing protein [Pseudooceanicola endophyticus]MXN19799.1 PAS domain-containing protein [Pseudooceanicola albus]